MTSVETTEKEKRETQKNSEEPVKLTKDLLNQYRDSLTRRGCGKQTISMYFCYLNRLYTFLTGDRELTNENLSQWITSLKKKGYSDRTINMHISSVNGLMRFCGHKKETLSIISIPRTEDLPELSREEYLQLLAYAKKTGSERNYLLIKTLATLDINVVDLPYLTVEACEKGMIELPNNHEIMIPDSFKNELLFYIQKWKLKSGSLFMTNRGNQMDRSNIMHDIRRLGEKAGLDPNKCNPRSLHRLYQQTQDDIDKELMAQHGQVYENLLDTELSKVS